MTFVSSTFSPEISSSVTTLVKIAPTSSIDDNSETVSQLPTIMLLQFQLLSLHTVQPPTLIDLFDEVPIIQILKTFSAENRGNDSIIISSSPCKWSLDLWLPDLHLSLR